MNTYRCVALTCCGLALAAARLRAENTQHGDALHIERAAGPIKIDGDLSDPGWKNASKITTWYETNPGDNTEPKVKNVGYLAYDDKYFYAAFEFFDPEPEKIRAPYGDRDNVPSYTDYGGILLDTRNDGKTGLLFVANARGIQYDSVLDDRTGNEDSSPDFYWDSAAKITKEGWVLEIRVPFSSLRYPKGNPQTWNILLYRNYPRDFRYQFFSAKMPRGGNCFVCRANVLTGLEGLPPGGRLTVVPYLNAKEEGLPRADAGSSFVNKPVRVDGGGDVKWTPNETSALDGTINPDFSQVESDVAQIAANQRFALFYPEKRPFFLEGSDLFATPIQAVYTRTITSPRWGARATGKLDQTAYTILVTQDRGGGSVILPGPNGSNFADQDFRSIVAIGRVRHELGTSFVSFLGADREVEGGGHNRVFGPDFQWRLGQQDTLTGQLLFSHSKTPDRPDLAAEWNGQTLAGHAADVWFSHSTSTWDAYTEYKDYSDGFRADDGFVPQVGYRENYAEVGYTFHPTGLISRLRAYLIADYQAEQDGKLISREISPGIGMDGVLSSFTRLRWAHDKLRAGDRTFDREQLVYTVQLTPSRTFSLVSLNGFVGQDVDFANSRRGNGANVTATIGVDPTIHLNVRFDGGWQWLNVTAEDGSSGRLFLAQYERIRATYTFTSRCFLRVIGQYVRTDRDPSLYTSPVTRRDGSLTASALFSYKINWQTVLFLGYGDNRTLTESAQLLRSDRQFFLKLSYAFQL